MCSWWRSLRMLLWGWEKGAVRRGVSRWDGNELNEVLHDEETSCGVKATMPSLSTSESPNTATSTSPPHAKAICHQKHTTTPLSARASNLKSNISTMHRHNAPTVTAIQQLSHPVHPERPHTAPQKHEPITPSQSFPPASRTQDPTHSKPFHIAD